MAVACVWEHYESGIAGEAESEIKFRIFYRGYSLDNLTLYRRRREAPEWLRCIGFLFLRVRIHTINRGGSQRLMNFLVSEGF